MTALALVVRVVAGAIAGVVVTLAAHFGLSLDQDAVVIPVAAFLTAVGAVVVHWLLSRYPWLERAQRIASTATIPDSVVGVPKGPANGDTN